GGSIHPRKRLPECHVLLRCNNQPLSPISRSAVRRGAFLLCLSSTLLLISFYFLCRLMADILWSLCGLTVACALALLLILGLVLVPVRDADNSEFVNRDTSLLFK